MPIKLFGIVLIMHGFVHLLYAGHSLRKFELVPGMAWPDNSRIFNRRVGAETTRKLIAICLTTSAIGFVFAGLGFLLRWGGYQTAAYASSIMSSLTFAIAWDGKPKELDKQGCFGVLINLVVILLINAMNLVS
jgi:hypothetical protein